MLDSILRKIAPYYLLIAKKVKIYKTISYHWNKFNTKEAHLIYINFAYGYFHDLPWNYTLYLKSCVKFYYRSQNISIKDCPEICTVGK